MKGINFSAAIFAAHLGLSVASHAQTVAEGIKGTYFPFPSGPGWEGPTKFNDTFPDHTEWQCTNADARKTLHVEIHCRKPEDQAKGDKEFLKLGSISYKEHTLGIDEVLSERECSVGKHAGYFVLGKMHRPDGVVLYAAAWFVRAKPYDYFIFFATPLPDVENDPDIVHFLEDFRMPGPSLEGEGKATGPVQKPDEKQVEIKHTPNSEGRETR